MTIAKEREVQNLREIYYVGAYEKLACYQNAVLAILKIFARDREELPWVYLVEFGSPEDPDYDVHTYLVYEGIVYQRGVTAVTKRFPDFHLDELRQYGRDITFPLLAQVAATLAREDLPSDWGVVIQLLPLKGEELNFLVFEATIKAGARSGHLNIEDLDHIFSSSKTS
jgi:hypothetical protein